MKYIHYFFVFIIFLFTVSCDRIQSKIDQVSREINSVEQSGPDVTQDKWLELENLINEVEHELSINRDQFTDQQIKEFNTLKGRYIALKIKRGFRDFKQSVKDFEEQLEGVVEGLMEDSI